MEEQITLMQAIERLRGDDPAAWEAVFRHTNSRVYFICKHVFANREAILRAMCSFYVTLCGALPPARELNDETACQRALDIWLFNVCKKQIKETHPESFQSEGGTWPTCSPAGEPLTAGLLPLMRDGCGMEPSEIAELLRVPEAYVHGQLQAAHDCIDREQLANARVKLNAETTQTLLDSIRAGLAERAALPRQAVPQSAEELTPAPPPEETQLDTKRLLRTIGAIAAALGVLIFAAVAVTMKSKGGADPLTSQTFDFANPDLSNLDDLAYSRVRTTTTQAPLPTAYIYISQEPFSWPGLPLPTQPPPTIQQTTNPTDTTTQQPGTQPTTAPPVTQPPVTTTATTTTIRSSRFTFTVPTSPTQPTQTETTEEEDPWDYGS